MIELTFLVHDSRSGSTFFARQLHNQYPSVAVTPEVSLYYAVMALTKNRRSTDQIRRALVKGRFFEVLGFSEDDFQLASPVSDATFSNYVRTCLADFVARNWPLRKAAMIVVKKGHHVFVAERLMEIFPDARFLCLYRDPRAVYESKNRTRRPYHPQETMGWAGTSLTVARWVQYCRAMRRLEKAGKGLRVKYEDLSTTKEAVLDQISGYLRMSRTPQRVDDYLITEAERSIHQRSISNSIAPRQESAWRKNLSSREIAIIELIARAPMQSLGYTKSQKASGSASIAFAMISLAKGLLSVLKRALSDSA
jgi:hypothetical protein